MEIVKISAIIMLFIFLSWSQFFTFIVFLGIFWFYRTRKNQLMNSNLLNVILLSFILITEVIILNLRRRYHQIKNIFGIRHIIYQLNRLNNYYLAKKNSLKIWAMGYALRLIFGNKSENINNKKEIVLEMKNKLDSTILKNKEEPTILKNKQDIDNFLNKLK
jgi:hypothetical protein